MGDFDGYALVPTSNLRRIADELDMEGGTYAPKLRREVLAYIEVSPSLFAEAARSGDGVNELRRLAGVLDAYLFTPANQPHPSRTEPEYAMLVNDELTKRDLWSRILAALRTGGVD